MTNRLSEIIIAGSLLLSSAPAFAQAGGFITPDTNVTQGDNTTQGKNVTQGSKGVSVTSNGDAVPNATPGTNRAVETATSPLTNPTLQIATPVTASKFITATSGNGDKAKRGGAPDTVKNGDNPFSNSTPSAPDITIDPVKSGFAPYYSPANSPVTGKGCGHTTQAPGDEGSHGRPTGRAGVQHVFTTSRNTYTNSTSFITLNPITKVEPQDCKDAATTYRSHRPHKFHHEGPGYVVPSTK